MAFQIHLKDFYHYLLMKFDNLVGVVHPSVGKLRDMHQSILMNPNIHKCPEISDICHNTRKHHSLLEVFYR